MPTTPTTMPPRRTGVGLAKRLLLGKKLASEEVPHQRLRKLLALPVFASDPLSSNAYATEEILLVLIAAGTTSFRLLLPIAAVIAVVLTIVIISYRQTVRAYPGGGGAYIVAKENVGEIPGLVAAGALLVDYILTVSVSISAGVFALVSLSPGLLPYRVSLSIFFILFITAMNLRGVRESGTLFAIPTYSFFVAVMVMIGVGLSRCLGGDCPQAEAPLHAVQATQGLTVFLILRAFSSGSTALTGVEAIANGVPAFQGRRPIDRAHNAATTLAMLGVMTVSMFIGISYLARRVNVVPAHDRSVISQVADTVFGGGPGFVVIQITTALILILAANTAYQDFPRLSSILARDRYLPRQFVNLGDRLVFSNGIFVLAAFASVLVVIYDADVTRLIQLYVVGVFTSFTLSQTGMVRRWLRLKATEPRWRRNATLNSVGASATGVVLVVIAATKFTHGAWIVMVAVPILVVVFKIINRHYLSVGRQLRIPEERPQAIEGTHAIIPVNGMDESVYEAIGYARAMRPNSLVAIHVGQPDEPLVAHWAEAHLRVPLEIVSGSIDDPVEAIRNYVRTRTLAPREVTTIILPEQYDKPSLVEVLRRRRALRIKTSMLFEPRVAVTDVPVLATGRPLALHQPSRIIAIVLVSALHNATLRAVEYARSLSPTETTAVTFNTEPDNTMRLLEAWATQVDDVAIEAVDSPYRSVTRPLLGYVRELRKRNPDAVVNIVLPEFVVRKLWHQVLHNQTALQIKRTLLFEPGVVVTSVPFHLS